MINYNNTITKNHNDNGDYIILILMCLIFVCPTIIMILSLCEYKLSSRKNYYELPRNNITAIAE
jgi:hypothetical protein